MRKVTKMDLTWTGCFVKKIIFEWFLFFHFNGKLLGIKFRRELKDNAIPTLFDHAPLPKQRRTSIGRLQNQTNRQIIEDRSLLRKLKKTHLGIHKVDKAIDNTPKMKSTRIQYSISYFKQESLIPPKVSTVLSVKAPQRKKQRRSHYYYSFI